MNPADTIRYAYQNSADPHVYELAHGLGMLIKELRMYRGFTIEYIDYFTQQHSVLEYNYQD